MTERIERRSGVRTREVGEALRSFDEMCRELTPVHPLFPDLVRTRGHKLLQLLGNSTADDDYCDVASVFKRWERDCVKHPFAHSAMLTLFREAHVLLETGVLVG